MNREIALIGAAYYRVADDIFNSYLKWLNSEEPQEKDDVKDRIILPAIVNMAFSTELCLKSLLPDGTRGHELKELYDKLDDSDKREIKISTTSELRYNDTKFEEDLQETSDTFRKWRYLHNYNRLKKAKYSFMKTMTETILDMYGIEHS